MGKVFVWGVNNKTKELIKSNTIKIDFIYDQYSNELTYQGINIIKEIDILKDEALINCIISSTTYYFDIKEKIEFINKKIKISYVGEYLSTYPRTIMLETQEDIENCTWVNSSIVGELFIEKGLVVQLLHDIPVSINVNQNAKLYLNNNVLMDGVEISAGVGAKVTLGDKTYINKFGIIRSTNLIIIGDNCAIAWNAVIMDNDGYDIGERSSKTTVKIGNDVWIGNNVNILKNTNIRNGCVIGSMSKVKGDFESRCLIVGNPAKKIRNNVKWK